MILAFDTHYFNNKAKTACICFEKWPDPVPGNLFTEIIEGIPCYESGAFYKRELPCILSLISKIPEKNIECIVVDGFVYLDDHGKHGLGGYLFEALNKEVPVIGVAKSPFRNNRKYVRNILRGKSKKPLYISAIGMNLDEACSRISSMNGAYRIPTLLKILDRTTKEIK